MEQHPSNNTEPIKLVIVDQSKDALDAARDQADRRLDQELGEGSGFKRFINGIWKGNIAKDYYRQKYMREAGAEIELAQDVLLYDAPEDRRGQAIEATIERFQSDYEELIHEDAGENKEILDTDNDLVVGMKDLIRRYCAGELNDETLVEERTRLLNAHQEINGSDGFERGIVTVDNLLDTARAVAGAIENGESIENTLDSMQVILGEARDGVRSEAQYNSVDRAIDKMARSRIGSLIGPEVIATAVTVAASVARLGSHSVVGAATKTVLPGVAAGLWAGLRENRRMKDERSQHSREMAQGRDYDNGSTRREEMEETRYDTVSANQLAESLRLVGDSEALEVGGNDALRVAIDALAAVNARIRMSDSNNIDLITFSNPAAVGDERMALDVARAELRVAIDSRLNEESRIELGFSEQDSIGDILNEQAEGLIEAIQDDISSKDRAFSRLKGRNVAKAVAVGIVSGLVIGQAFQEGLAAADPTRAGLLEQLWGAKTTTIDGVEHQTVLQGLFAGDQTTIHTGPSSEYSTQAFGENGELSVSSDHSIVTNENGTFSLVDPNGHITAENIPINDDGSLPESSIEQLSKLGMVVSDKSFDEEIITTHNEEVSANDFVKNHLEDTTRVKRDLWYDNDTPAPNYDKNEHGLHWGGDNGITDNGYQFSVAGMTADGSYHGSNSVNWAEAAKDGNLMLAISATGDTQNQVFMVNVGADGKIDIPSDSLAAKFFSNEGGRAVFNGRYAEVVHMTGTDSNGVEHMRPLATLVGDKNPGSIIDQVSKTTIEHHNVYEITTPGYDTIQENFTEMAPVIPIVSRRSLETLMAKKLNNPNIPPMYYGGETLESMTDWLHSNPDRLKTRRKIVNSEGESEWVEIDGSPVVRSVERERSALTDYLNRESIKDPVHMQTVERIVESMNPMSDECRVAINVPAWMEGSNLNNWLEQFTTQIDKDGNPLDPELYELNVIVNRKTGTEADDSVEVIEAFIANFKQIHGFSPKVNYYDIELDPPNNNVGYSRKLITDAVLVRSLRRQDQASSLYIETEDADVVHADPRTVHNLIEKFDSNPHLDALRGKQDRDPSQLQNNDYLFMRMRAMQFFEVLARQKRFQEPNNPAWNYTWNRVVTGGWNTGYTAEAYADIDGYDNVVLGEDMPIGQRISMIRGDGVVPNLEVVGTVKTRSDSSPRRYIQEIINGRGAYAEFDNEEDNKEIREKSINELMKVIKSHARISEENSADFASFLNVILGWSKTVTGGSEAESEAMTRRILFMLGFKKDDYEIINGTQINFKSWQNFKSSLDRYRLRAALV